MVAIIVQKAFPPRLSCPRVASAEATGSLTKNWWNGCCMAFGHACFDSFDSSREVLKQNIGNDVNLYIYISIACETIGLIFGLTYGFNKS